MACLTFFVVVLFNVVGFVTVLGQDCTAEVATFGECSGSVTSSSEFLDCCVGNLASCSSELATSNLSTLYEACSCFQATRTSCIQAGRGTCGNWSVCPCEYTRFWACASGNSQCTTVFEAASIPGGPSIIGAIYENNLSCTPAPTTTASSNSSSTPAPTTTVSSNSSSTPAPSTALNSSDPSPSATASPSSNATSFSPNATSGGNPDCFPAEAWVTLVSGESRTMADLNIGDVVLSGTNQFSPVFFFGHRDHKISSSYMRITATSGSSILLSPGHLILTSKGTIPARDVDTTTSVQDSNGVWQKVTSVTVESHKGLFMPHTVSGTIVVNGVVASTYSSVVPTSIAQALLLPERLLFGVGLSLYGSMLEVGRPALVERAMNSLVPLLSRQ